MISKTDMDDLLETIASRWARKAGATTDQLSQAETDLGLKLPDDYKKFMLWSNGGEGPIGGSYLSLWSTEEIKVLNEDYQIGKYLPGILAIGTDGGGECFAFDYNESDANPSLIQVPLGDLDVASIIPIGRTFLEGLRKN